MAQLYMQELYMQGLRTAPNVFDYDSMCLSNA